MAGGEIDWIHLKDENTDQYWLVPDILKREGITLPRSDESGLLTIKDLPPSAAVTMRIQHSNFVRQIIDVKNAVDRGPVPVVMQRGSPLFVEVVVAATGEPAVDASVRVSGFPNAINIHDEAVDAEGRFTTRLGELQHVNISVKHPTLLARKRFSFRGWNPTDPVGERVRFELFPQAKVTGRVLGPGNEPLAGVEVVLTADRHELAFGRTNEKGQYEITGPAGWCEVSVRIKHGFYGEPRRTHGVQLSPDKLTEASRSFFARRVPRSRGVAVLPDGRPVSGAFIHIPHSFPDSPSRIRRR